MEFYKCTWKVEVFLPKFYLIDLDVSDVKEIVGLSNNCVCPTN